MMRCDCYVWACTRHWFLFHSISFWTDSSSILAQECVQMYLWDSMSIGSLTHMGTQGHLCRSCHGSPLAKFPHRSELQDSKAEKALDALKKLAPECAMVLRNGNWQSTLGCSGCVKVCLWKHRCEMKWGGSLSQTPGNCTLALLA